MYKKADRDQFSFEEFFMPFGGKLNTDNRWIKLSQIMPWDFIEDIYVQSLAEDGAPAFSARIAFGALYIKENENLSDRDTVAHIAENPYMQYFLGLHEFQTEPLFDPSLMVHLRKRFSAEAIEQINKKIFVASQEKNDNDDDSPNHGKLILDSTCAPADIRYPSDLSLLNEARENTEQIIDELWVGSEKKGHKTSYNRKKARKQYLSIAKKRKPVAKKQRKVIGDQLSYLCSNIEQIGKLLMQTGLDILEEKHFSRLMTICTLYRQQRFMYENRVHKCENRIVSLRQPHVRTMVRGKAGKRFEFGQKLAFSVVNGYTFIEKQSFDSFNEGISLIESARRYKATYGHYPEAILADQIYRNRDNLAFCKERGIRLSGPKLGRPSKAEAARDRELEYRDCCERNIVESRNGIAKRRFGLGLIMAYLPETAMTEAAFQVLCMNLSLRLKSLWLFLEFYLLGNDFVVLA